MFRFQEPYGISFSCVRTLIRVLNQTDDWQWAYRLEFGIIILLFLEGDKAFSKYGFNFIFIYFHDALLRWFFFLSLCQYMMCDNLYLNHSIWLIYFEWWITDRNSNIKYDDNGPCYNDHCKLCSSFSRYKATIQRASKSIE